MKKHYANIISWSSFMFSILFLLLIKNGILNINFSFLAVLLAAFLDMFDGKVARKYLSEKKDFLFGEITDSLCDIINFGVFPVLIFSSFFSQFILINFICVSTYLFSCVFRLARFSRDKDCLKVNYYSGLPVTIAGPLAVFLCLIFRENIFVTSFIFISLSFLMISNIKFKKF